MSVILIFIWVAIAFIIMSYLEKTIEGPNAWAKKSYGWKFKISKNLSITEYHLTFWTFILMLGFLPFIIYGFNLKLLGILISAFAVGFIVEDFFYFVVNPYWGLKNFNKRNAGWYPWLKIGRFQIPLSYIVGIALAILSWYFLWK